MEYLTRVCHKRDVTVVPSLFSVLLFVQNLGDHIAPPLGYLYFALNIGDDRMELQEDCRVMM